MADPFRRPPMVDFAHPAGHSLFWRISAAMDRLVEQLENHSPADLFFQKVDRDIAEAERVAQNSTPARSPGGTMSIDNARAAIMGAHQDAQTGLAQLANTRDSLERAQTGLRHGTEGSNQAEADQAHSQLAEALTKIAEAEQQVASALQEFEGVAQRL